MALPPSPSDASPLLGHLETLYPLACLLVGPEEVPDLLLRVYQQAAEHPDGCRERPDDLEGRLLALLRETSEELASSGKETVREETTSAPEADAHAADPLRQDVAEQLVDDALPVALAACSPHERFLLAADAFEASRDLRTAHLAESSDTTSSDARTALRSNLRAVLSEPEYALVDEALSDAFLQHAVRELVATRFSPVPSSLRSRIRAILQTARAAEETSVEEDDPSSPESSSLLDSLPSQPRPRALLLTLLIGVAVLAGGIGVSYLIQSSSGPSSSSTSLVAFSAEQASTVTPDMTTNSQFEAEAYVESTWGRQIQVPSIEGARLQGVGRVRTASDAEIPVFLYADVGDSTRIATFAYSYALVDQIEATATLDTRIRSELARRHHLVAKKEASREGLLWRDRDDIFVAVAPSIPADSLRTRLRP